MSCRQQACLPISQVTHKKLSLDQLLQRTALEAIPEPDIPKQEHDKSKDIVVLVCATANVLTLHPADEDSKDEIGKLDSQRRLDLAAQFQHEGYTIVGLQETRLRRPRAFPMGPFFGFSAAAGDKGQAGLELWIKSDFLQKQHQPLVVHASKRIRMVKEVRQE